jgi:hypothetical protein
MKISTGSSKKKSVSRKGKRGHKIVSPLDIGGVPLRYAMHPYVFVERNEEGLEA